MAWRLPLLQQGEEIRMLVRRHPAAQLSPAVLLAGVWVADGLLTATVVHGSASNLLWLAGGVLFVRFCWSCLRWSIDYYLVTSLRIVTCRGLIVRNITAVPLTQVVGIRLRRSHAAVLFGYGDLVVESISPERPTLTLDHMPYPEAARQELAMIVAELNDEDAPPR